MSGVRPDDPLSITPSLYLARLSIHPLRKRVPVQTHQLSQPAGSHPSRPLPTALVYTPVRYVPDQLAIAELCELIKPYEEHRPVPTADVGSSRMRMGIDADSVRWQTYRWLDDSGGRLSRFLVGDNLRRGAFEPGREEMKGTLKGLGKHAWDLESYLEDITPSSVRDLITSHLSFPTSVLPHLTASTSSPNPNPSSTSATTSSSSILPSIQILTTWFKSSFFKWIDPIPCPVCSSPTTSTSSTSPTPAESAEGGGRVELHTCTSPTCGSVRRFVRYGKVSTLLKTRKGRCGEWAHCYYAVLRCLGVEARYVWNSEDHVWVEVWDETGGRWVHVDPCEAAVDKPLLYAKGWGKKQAYCISVGPQGLEDVTRAYVDDWADCLVRRRARGWSEKTLQLALTQMTISLRLPLSPEERQRLDVMDKRQREWLMDEPRRLREAEEEEMGGRVSGPEEWRKARDEMGDQVGEGVIMPQYTVVSSIYNLKSPIDTYLLGSAERRGGKVVLTTGSDQTAAFFPDIRLKRDRTYRITLDFRIDSPDGKAGADGMALACSSGRGIGKGGFGLGYDGLGEDGDWAVEIDTYRSQDHANDPPVPHVSLHSPLRAHHRYSHACSGPGQLPLLGNGHEGRLQVLYDAEKHEVYAAFGERASGEELKQSLWKAAVPPCKEGQEGNDWFVGVTAACGGLWQTQEVLNLSVEEVKQGHVPIETDTEGAQSVQDAR